MHKTAVLHSYVEMINFVVMSMACQYFTFSFSCNSKMAAPNAIKRMNKIIPNKIFYVIVLMGDSAIFVNYVTNLQFC